ncbi:hypothetical protein [Arenimonas sp.]|uniref:hypothetical protein n=1 Tax=Arenimonas sp. TaxID=1872635 RepID=UPI0035B1C4B1
MGTTRFTACLFMMLGLCLPVWSGPAFGADSLQQRLDRFMELEEATFGRLSSTERAAKMAAGFDRDFGDLRESDLADLELPELQAYYRAANLAQFHAHRDQDLEAMEAALAELARRKQASPEDLQDMFGAYMAVRAFDEAGRLATTHKLQAPEPVPEVVSQLPAGFAGASLLKPMASEDGVARLPFAPTTDAYIVAVSHPLCRPSQRAMAAIEADAGLMRIFRGNAHWVAPADRRLQLDVLRTWNAAHPLTQFSLAWRRDEWPQIDHWATPTFYFFAGGELVAKVSGWPEEGRREELVAAARKAGLD